MPVALIVAFALSLGAHALALFGTDLDLAPSPEPPPLEARLRPLPLPLPQPVAQTQAPTRSAKPPRRPAPAAKPAPHAKATGEPASVQPPESLPLPEAPEAPATPIADVPQEPDDEALTSTPVAAAASGQSRLPPAGLIRFRVERGDQGLVVGRSVHEWKIDAEGRYRLTAITETVGLAALIKPLRIQHESVGRIGPEGLQPEHFSIRRDGRETAETAVFDRERGEVRIGSRPPQALVAGAQDLLSFHYQLGFMAEPGGSLPIATGKKFDTYLLDVVGDEILELPAGRVRTLHLKTRGEKVTELWLAYDYLMLPVKIRHSDPRGDSFVQVATELQLSKE